MLFSTAELWVKHWQRNTFTEFHGQTTEITQQWSHHHKNITRPAEYVEFNIPTNTLFWRGLSKTISQLVQTPKTKHNYSKNNTKKLNNCRKLWTSAHTKQTNQTKTYIRDRPILQLQGPQTDQDQDYQLSVFWQTAIIIIIIIQSFL